MKCAIPFFLFFNALLAVKTQSEVNNYKDVTSCGQLPKRPIDMQVLINNSPLTVIAYVRPQYNCSRNVYIGHSGGNTASDYAVINLQKGDYETTNVALNSDNTVGTLTFCLDNLSMHLYYLEFNFNNGNSYHCTYSCSADQTKLERFMCIGRTGNDYAKLQSIISSLGSLLTSSGLTVGFSPSSCLKGPYCTYFNQ